MGLENTSKSENSGLQGTGNFNFTRYCKFAFQNGYIKFQLFPLPCQHMVYLALLKNLSERMIQVS